MSINSAPARYFFLDLAFAFPLPLRSSVYSESDDSPPPSSDPAFWALVCLPSHIDDDTVSGVSCNLLPFSMMISLSHPFSRRKSAASLSSSSARPVRSVTDRSRLMARCFFLIRKRAEMMLFVRFISKLVKYLKLLYFGAVCHRRPPPQEESLP